eukprot:GCRY01001109.1.p1 GENE.GCRY01001109.1~~GCRY01001109.1.p1  ORF type:complete len:547 (+),score=41.21 GCRY01001109.1:84-1724(+)
MTIKHKLEARLTALLLCLFLILISPAKSEDKLFCYNPIDVAFISNLGSQPPFFPRVSCDASGLMILPANLVPSVQSCESRFPNCLYCDGVSCSECQPDFSLLTIGSETKCIPPCGLGYYYDYNRDLCDLCPNGTYWDPEVTTACKECGAGTYSVVGQTACDVCGEGAVASLSGSAVCERCDEGFYANALHTACIKCSAGSMCHNGINTLCMPGTFQIMEGQDACSVCPRNEYCNLSGCTSCEACPSHAVTSGTSAYSHDSPADCICAPGYAGSTSCVRCGAGSACLDGQKHPCEPGTYAPSESSACSVCDDGFFNPYSFASGCIPCPPGSSAIGPSPSDHLYYSQCVCMDGYTHQEGTDGCVICSAGTSCVGGVVHVCEPGTFSHAGSSNCTVCADGTYTPTTGSTSCLHCPSNSTTPQTSNIADHDALTDCACIPGTTGPDPLSCELCPAGFSCPTPAAVPIPCPPGTYSAAGASACAVCPPDTYSEGTVNFSCSTCPPHSRIDSNTASDHSSLYLCDCDFGYKYNRFYERNSVSVYCFPEDPPH